MKKLTLQSILHLVAWTVICGAIYPFVMTVICQFLFHNRAEGSLVYKDGNLVGSEFMAQQFQGDKYFWPRPSACSYGYSASGFGASGGSNFGPTSAQLQTNVNTNLKALRDAHHLAADAPVPSDLVFASASGVDPEISPEGARFQIARVAAARKMSVDDVTALVEKHLKPAQWGILGEPRVNVLLLNLDLDAAQK